MVTSLCSTTATTGKSYSGHCPTSKIAMAEDGATGKTTTRIVAIAVFPVSAANRGGFSTLVWFCLLCLPTPKRLFSSWSISEVRSQPAFDFSDCHVHPTGIVFDLVLCDAVYGKIAGFRQAEIKPAD